ncbi:MAG TPA: hypothetical protein VEB60_02755 [Candidatus Paceibacterota bacterium]|nr:hypothetical protein [Candidatus Paceibacterota bacterium]
MSHTASAGSSTLATENSSLAGYLEQYLRLNKSRQTKEENQFFLALIDEVRTAGKCLFNLYADRGTVKSARLTQKQTEIVDFFLCGLGSQHAMVAILLDRRESLPEEFRERPSLSGNSSNYDGTEIEDDGDDYASTREDQHSYRD